MLEVSITQELGLLLGKICIIQIIHMLCSRSKQCVKSWQEEMHDCCHWNDCVLSEWLSCDCLQFCDT